MDLAHGYEGPPLDFPLEFIQTIVNRETEIGLRQSDGFDDTNILVFFSFHFPAMGYDVVPSKA